MLRKLLLLIIALLPLMALSQSSGEADQKQSEPTAFSAGVLYYRDPRTGELTTPPPGTARRLLQDRRNFSDEGLEMVILPDGTKMIDLQGRFQMSATLQTDADGNYIHHCTSHPNTVNAAEHAALHSDIAEQ